MYPYMASEPFTLPPSRTLQMDLPVFELSGIQGRVFEDANQNGLLDPGESGIPHVLITDGTHTTLTDANGGFRFDGLNHGSYTLRLDPNTLPARSQTSSETLILEVGQGSHLTDASFPVEIMPRPVIEYEF